MKKTVLIIVGLVLLVGIAAFFQFGPGMVERSMNKVDGEPLIEVSDEAKALHKTLTIVDLHSDTLLWNRNLLDRGTRGHMDLPRLEEGNVALQVFSSVTKTPKGQNYDANDADSDNITPLVIAQLQPTRTWNSLLERSLWHAEKLERAAAKSDGELLGIASPKDLDRLLRERSSETPKPVGALLSIEACEAPPSYVDSSDDCDDLDPLTSNDTCDADGVCSGIPIECDVDPCIKSATPNGETCIYQWHDAGLSCDDDTITTNNDACPGDGKCEGQHALKA